MRSSLYAGLATAVAVAVVAGAASTATAAEAPYVDLKREAFQKEIDGKKVDLYTIKNRKGTLVVRITNYGAKVEQILVPDRDGNLGDIAAGYDSIEGALNGQGSMGAFIGRYANRIGGGKLMVDGKSYQLAKNNGENSLHGGQKGSRFVVFDAKQLGPSSVQMTYVFKDGEENYPGTVPVRVIYSVTDGNEFRIDYTAVAADKTTVINFTGHTFFNLSGKLGTSILDHVITVNADRFLPVDGTLIPTGELRKVEGTVMDFRKPVAFGARIEQADEQLKLGNGYDHHFALNKKRPGTLEFAAKAMDPKSGRVMEVWTTEPGMQLFSGNNLEGKQPRDVAKGGAVMTFRTAFCMEPSHFPDSPNKPSFPTTLLKPGEWYTGQIAYKFKTDKAK